MANIRTFPAALLCLGVLCSPPRPVLAQESLPGVAVVTGLRPVLSVIDYDISLRTAIATASLDMSVACAVRNDGLEPVERVDFDLFAREHFYGMKVAISEVAQVEGSGPRPLSFTRAPFKPPADPALAGSEAYPLITRVSLAAPLKSGEVVRLRFRYTLTHVDPSRRNLPYRIVATLPSGLTEICLISDFSWLPWITWPDYAQVQALDKANFFTRSARPKWQIAIRTPSEYQALVVDGRLEKTEAAGGDTITTWANRTDGLPQLMIGCSDRIEVRDGPESVVFLLAKGGYDRNSVDSKGRFMIRAFRFFTRLWGELPGHDIHIAGSSAGMGGHGAFLGTFLDIRTFQKKGAAAAGFDETAAHELAHSWWGISISSYGRGTKFLREAFCNFGTWLFAKREFGLDLFQDNLAYLFFRGTAKNRLFEDAGDSAALAYTKGALVLDVLRQEMGDETFYRIIKLFADTHRNAHITFTDFVSLCNEKTLRDWLPFFVQWCYGEGYPAYGVEGFESKPVDGRWTTTVTIRNGGQGIVVCPLALVTGGTSREETFRVPAGEVRSFRYDTPARVDKVVIDPRHRAYQGDATEARLKLLGVEETGWPWLNYFIGLLHAELGDGDKALDLLSKAVVLFEEELGTGKAAPPLYYSRGIMSFRRGDMEGARRDLSLFLDGVFGSADNPKTLNDVLRSFNYAVLVSGTAEERQEQLLRILQAVTGKDFGLDPTLSAWRVWWAANRSGYQVPAGAASLSPKGYGPRR